MLPLPNYHMGWLFGSHLFLFSLVLFGASNGKIWLVSIWDRRWVFPSASFGEQVLSSLRYERQRTLLSVKQDRSFHDLESSHTFYVMLGGRIMIRSF